MRPFQRLILAALAVGWLLLRIPYFGDRYSFEWDSSQFARGVAEFNIFKHQPHPSGYYLWVLATRDLTAVTSGPMQAQIVLAFLMALGGLAMFYLLARRFLSRDAAFGATVLLAYAPAVSLHSSIPLSTITDLLTSAIAGYFAFLDSRARRWRIVVCMGALGFIGGFRQSGVGLVAPFVAAAALKHWRVAWRHVCGGALLGAALFLAWYIPLADTVGGWRVLSRLSSEQFHYSAQGTSVFLGAPLARHIGMIEENILYFAMNLAGWIAAYGIAWLWQRRQGRPSVALPLRDWWLFAIWLLPNLVMVFALHGAKAGYCLLCFPPLLLLCASIATRPWLPAIVAGVVVALAIGYFPYARFLSPHRYTVAYLLYRSAPLAPLELEQSQRNLDASLRELKRYGAPQPFVCARGLPEAPNIRTVTYDFNYVQWVEPAQAPPYATIWLFDWRGPDEAARARFPSWRKLSGDRLLSLWQAATQ